ncbi:hypothetical protein [Spirosoma gilvum]
MNKKTLSDVARQNNTARVTKFASSIIPSAPEQQPPVVVAEPSPVAPVESLSDVIKQGESDFAEGKGTTLTTDQLRETTKAADPAPVARSTRKRSSTLSMDDIIGPKAPEDETFAKMTRIAEKHHELLREIAYKHRKPMNTILYNLLEALDQTYQREQQNHA